MTVTALLKKIPRKLRYLSIYNNTYQKTLDFLEESQYWSEQEKLDYQMKKLKETCTYAYNYVPYYKKLFDDAGFDVKRLNHFDDMGKIPFLTKSLIQENIDDMVSTAIPEHNMFYVTTSGSTGIPTGLYHTLSMAVKEKAFINHMWKRVGFGEMGGGGTNALPF